MPINLVIIAQKDASCDYGTKRIKLDHMHAPFLLINIMVSIELGLEPDSSSILVSLSRDYNILNYMVLSNFKKFRLVISVYLKRIPFKF